MVALNKSPVLDWASEQASLPDVMFGLSPGGYVRVSRINRRGKSALGRGTV